MTKKKAPEPAATGLEGQNPEGINLMTTMADSGRFSDYSTVVRADHGRVLVERNETGEWVRFHYRIYRVPSRREFVLRHCEDATEHDRRKAEKMLASMPSGGWVQFGDRWGKWRAAQGHYVWSVFLGRYMDDPLVQLELEMMIDLHNGAVAS